jgi:hypothetical protein
VVKVLVLVLSEELTDMPAVQAEAAAVREEVPEQEQAAEDLSL